MFSPSWYRVAALKPRLRNHFEVHRQVFRDDVVYVLQDHSTGKFYSFNAEAYDIIGRMNGVRSVHEIWEAGISCHGDDAPSQDETIALLGRLHAIDALHADVTADCMEIFRRAKRSKKSRWQSIFQSPFSMRFSLLDPDRLLAAMQPYFGSLFSMAGFCLWLLVVGAAVVLAAANWTDLAHGAADRILDPKNLLFLLLIFPLMKVCHELGHALATKKWGGEVHELGVSLLVFMPVPYVDASAATAITSKYRRMLVSAAGMMVELFLAAIALFVWLSVEPGLLRLAAFNVVLVGGISTLVFNGNPLLRFDAYYILKDAIEIPNLASRSTRYLSYLAQRYLFGLESAESPETRSGEWGWLLFYGIASALYRVLITVTIVLFVAGKFFIIGVLIAAWAAVVQIAMPAVRMASFVLFSRALDQHRARAVAVSGTLVAVIGVLLFAAPVPSTTDAEGVLWLPDRAQVHAGADGVVTELLAEPFSKVQAGQPLLVMQNPLLDARLDVLRAEVQELEVRHRIEKITDPVEASVIVEQITARQAELDREAERAGQLVVRSGSDGTFVLRRAADLPGRFVRQGELIGFVLDDASMIVRVVVPQHRVGLVRESVRAVDVKIAESLGRTIPAVMSRDIPAAQQRLPSPVLGKSGGGAIAVAADDETGVTPMTSVFQFDLKLSEPPDAWRIGQRAYVKFDHGREPLAAQWLRRARQLFLRRFSV